MKTFDLNNITKGLCFLLAVTAFFAILGIAGRCDYEEQVIYTMPQEAYETIYLKLGDGCSNKQIINEYMNNKKFYDSLSW